MPALIVLVVGTRAVGGADPRAERPGVHPAAADRHRRGAGGELERRPLVAGGRRLATLLEAIGGLVIGTVAGVVVGVRRRALGDGAGRRCCPLAIAANAIPIIAIAPILNNWFGVLNPLSKMMIAALLVFFPVMINVTRGLTQVEPAALELMRSYAASETDDPRARCASRTRCPTSSRR